VRAVRKAAVSLLVFIALMAVTAVVLLGLLRALVLLFVFAALALQFIAIFGTTFLFIYTLRKIRELKNSD